MSSWKGRLVRGAIPSCHGLRPSHASVLRPGRHPPGSRARSWQDRWPDGRVQAEHAAAVPDHGVVVCLHVVVVARAGPRDRLTTLASPPWKSVNGRCGRPRTTGRISARIRSTIWPVTSYSLRRLADLGDHLPLDPGQLDLGLARRSAWPARCSPGCGCRPAGGRSRPGPTRSRSCLPNGRVVLEGVRLVQHVDVLVPVGHGPAGRPASARLHAEPVRHDVGPALRGRSGPARRAAAAAAPRSSMRPPELERLGLVGGQVQHASPASASPSAGSPPASSTPTSAICAGTLTSLTSARDACVLLVELLRHPEQPLEPLRRSPGHSARSAGRPARRRRPCTGCRSRSGPRPGTAPRSPAWPGRRGRSGPAACARSRADRKCSHHTGSGRRGGRWRSCRRG